MILRPTLSHTFIDNSEFVNLKLNIYRQIDNKNLISISYIHNVSEKLPEALATRCAKCTEKQKQTGKQVAKEVKKNYPEIWQQLVAMYDPEGKYQKAWEDFLKE